MAENHENTESRPKQAFLATPFLVAHFRVFLTSQKEFDNYTGPSPNLEYLIRPVKT